MKDLLRSFLTFLGVIAACIVGWYVWGFVNYVTSESSTVRLDNSKQQCLVALLAKSAQGEEEMAWTLKAYDNLRTEPTRSKLSPCDLLASYELNRAPSQKPSAAAVRNADFIVEIEGRLWHKERVRKATVMVEKYNGGDRSMFDTQKYPDMKCVKKVINYVGPFWVDASGADEKAMNREMRRVNTAPGGAKPHFFCPK